MLRARDSDFICRHETAGIMFWTRSGRRNNIRPMRQAQLNRLKHGAGLYERRTRVGFPHEIALGKLSCRELRSVIEPVPVADVEITFNRQALGEKYRVAL